MMVEIGDAIEAVGTLLAAAAGIAAITRWLLAKIDKADAENGRRVARLHDRLDAAYTVFAQRDDMNRHIERLENSVDGLGTKIDALGLDMSRRLDGLGRDLVGHMLNGRRKDTEG